MRTFEKLLVGFVVLCGLALVVGVATAPLRAQDTPPAPPGAADAGAPAAAPEAPAAPAEGAPIAPPAAAEAQGGPNVTPPATPPGGATPPAGTAAQPGAKPIEVKPTPPAVDYAKDADRQKAEFRADIARRKHPWDKKEMYENERAWERNVIQNDYNWAPAHKDMGGECGSTWWREYCGN